MGNKFYANKNFGQHFLTNQSVIAQIANNGPLDRVASILEIGPGPGALTHPLATLGLPLYVVEKDLRFQKLWEEKLGAEKVWMGDALEINLEDNIKSMPNNIKPIWAVSNLPYNAGTPIAVRLMQCPDIEHLTLMFQREVAQKFLMKEDMNSIGALAQIYFEVSLLAKVAPGSFSPPPKVHSTVIALSRRKNPAYQLEKWNDLEDFFAKLFAHRRKTISNVLKPHFDQNKLKLALEKANLSGQERSETFNLDQVKILYDVLH
jgi:16S rRNA (adenine1518-N6/adenine1519-N6)-dimethyltransferase